MSHRRRIIQISQAKSSESGQSVLALCNDGTLWESWFNGHTNHWDRWRELPPIPQPRADTEDDTPLRQIMGV